MNIPKDKPVMITGATGYLGGWIVKKLLEQGLTVHAAVRDPDKKEKRAHLDAIAEASPGSIRYFRGDLLEEGSYAGAMEGCGVVFHTASPFARAVEDPQKDLVDPARLGTRNVLEEANRTQSVDRVVLTSSCAAIYGDNSDIGYVTGEKFTEEMWNRTSSLEHQPYSFSKTQAEQEAWEIAESQDRWRLLVINPSFILGPAKDPEGGGESISFMVGAGDGSMKAGVPAYGMGMVDVREVSEAHLRAAFLPGVEGRHILSAHDSSFAGVAEILRDEYGDEYPVPRRTLPKWLVWLIGPMLDKSMTRKIISKNVDVPWRGDHTKSVRELGIEYRPMRETITDMFDQLAGAGRIAKNA